MWRHTSISPSAAPSVMGVWRSHSLWPHAQVTHTGTPALMAAEHMWTRYTQHVLQPCNTSGWHQEKALQLVTWCSFTSAVVFIMFAVEDVIPLPVPPTPVQHITYPEWKSTPPCCCGGLHSISRVYSVVCGIQGCQRHQDYGRVVVVWCCGPFNGLLRSRCLHLMLQSSLCWSWTSPWSWSTVLTAGSYITGRFRGVLLK